MVCQDVSCRTGWFDGPTGQDFPLISIRMEVRLGRSWSATSMPMPFCRRRQISAGDFADYSMLIRVRVKILNPCRGTAFFDEPMTRRA